jgi:uncharacterized protein
MRTARHDPDAAGRRRNHRLRTTIAAGVVAAAGWGAFESQWVQLSRRQLPIRRLPASLSGLRIAHLSDLHIGSFSLNRRAAEAAVNAIHDTAADVICVTGDLRARVGGTSALLRQLERLAAPLGVFAVLGNHDYADGLDPFADGRPLTADELARAGVRLLQDETVAVTHNATTIRIGGVAPRTFDDPRVVCDAHALADPAASLGVLLCHFPTILDRVTPGDWQVVLAGHLHGGQICVPHVTGKIRLSHASRGYLEGVYEREGTTMHVSRGIGTTFVPFRFAARPEVTLLELVAV